MPYAGYIKLHRSILDWEWYSDLNTRVLFIHLLLKANHESKEWQGVVVERGQLITGLHELSKQTGLSVKQVRLSLTKLISTGEVTRTTTNKYSSINVMNYGKYQCRDSDEGKQDGNQKDKPRASEGQAEGKQRATNKNDKNDKKERKEEDIIPPTPREGENDHPVRESFTKPQAVQIIRAWTSSLALEKTLTDFYDSRRALKKPMTENALNLMLKKLEQLAKTEREQIEILEESIRNGYQGIFAIKKQSGYGGSKPVETDTHSKNYDGGW